MRSRAVRYAALGGGLLVLVLGALGVLDEKDPVIRMNQGIGLLEEYNYSAARNVFEALAKEHPDWEAAHVNRGIAALNAISDILGASITFGAWRETGLYVEEIYSFR